MINLLISQLFHVSILGVVLSSKALIICFYCTLACLQNFSGGLLWPKSRRNREITQSCSTLHPSFRSRVSVGIKCNDDGTWGPVDYGNCTALNDAIPTLTVSFIVNVSQAEAEVIMDNVSLNLCYIVHA